jgi:telomerase reverse transcriptase
MTTSNHKIASTNLATPVSCVSAFCQAVIKKVIPKRFWGSGELREHNEHLILRSVDQFIRARKYETFSLDEIMNSLKVINVSFFMHNLILTIVRFRR